MNPDSPSKYMEPDFIVIGAMKSATTTLYHHLSTHPKVYMSRLKETQFFSRDHVYAKGMDWYRELFVEARPGQLRGEASTCYSRQLRYPDAAPRIARHLPKVKLVYIMRHPVERIYSHYGHVAQKRWNMERPTEVLTLDEFLNGDPEGEEALDASHYMRQIEAYLAFFPRERMHFITLDRFKSEAGKVLDELQAFLGLPRVDLVKGKSAFRRNERGRGVARARISRTIHRIRRMPGVSLAADLAGERFRGKAHARIRSFLLDTDLVSRASRTFSEHLSPFGQEIRNRLLNEFSESTHALENFLGEDLSSWYR